MKKPGAIILVVLLALAFASPGLAQVKSAKFRKFGEDKRALAWKNKKWTTSEKKITWRISDPWGSLNFAEITKHFCDTVRAASGGRLDIKWYPTGSIVPAMEIFDSTVKGTLDAFHSWPGFWRSKNEAFVAFGSVPFGMDTEGYNIWYYERGGKEMFDELYGRYGLVPFFCGNAGQVLGLHSNKMVTNIEDFKGMKVVGAGWYMDILNQLGALVTPLPGPDVYEALEKGVVDACESRTPAADIPSGVHEITRYVIEPGVHQPSCQFDVVINKQRWDELPDDLKAIVEISAKETQLWANAWEQNLNIDALEIMSKTTQFVRMDDATIVDFAKATFKYLDEVAARNPDVKKVLDSQEEFKKQFAFWREMRGGVVPWPREMVLQGKLRQ
jgi:TRAP-type mannitol/chloroaromatic compound transport system substrate-binding protein